MSQANCPGAGGEMVDHLVVPHNASSDKAAASGADGEKKKAIKRRASSDVPKDVTKAKKKLKKLKDLNAPRTPINGYVRYLNKNRERVKVSDPDMPFPEVTKFLAAEWMALPAEDKQIFLDEAEKDKERYNKEFEAYRGSDSYRLFMQKQVDAESVNKNGGDTQIERYCKEKPVATSKASSFEKLATGQATSHLDMPIFTEQFLEHNKKREAELRQLRKYSIEFEEQNAILSKHSDNMQAAVEKLELELRDNMETNKKLQEHLDRLRSLFVSSFSDIPIPGTNERPTVDTIEPYMTKLHQKLVLENAPKEFNYIRDLAKQICEQLD